jgi:hypothetical protein
MPTSLKSTDDRLHPPGSDTDWRESFSFDLHDDAGRAGMAYITVSPHRGVVDRIVIMFKPQDGKTLVYMQQDPLTHFEDAVLEQGVLQFHCLEPLQHWQLQAEVDCLSLPLGQEISSALAAARTGDAPVERLPVAFDLRFEARMPAYRFPDGAWDYLGPGQQHFEQMGQVTGWLYISDEKTPFVGLSGRDRSWGIRDWLRPEWYNWINLQFGEDFFVGATLSRADGQEASSGFVYQDGLLQPIAQVVIEAQRDPDNLHLLAGQAHIVTEQGQTFEVGFAPLSFFHAVVAREGTWQDHDNVTLVTCRCEGRTSRGFWEYNQRELISPLAPGQGGIW